MRYRNLGDTGLKVSELALGCLPFGCEVDEKSSIKIIDAASEAGINLFDTSDSYNEGRSEEILGKAVKAYRNKILIATKVGTRVGEGPNDVGLSRKHIMSAVEKSLYRLQTDYIDLYQVHWYDPLTQLDETLGAMDNLVSAGKVRYIGCSNFNAWQLCKALWVSQKYKLASFTSVQPRYNLITRWIEHDLLPLCVSERVGVVVYNPLAGGLLTGKYREDKQAPVGTRFALREISRLRYWYDWNFEALEQLKNIAQLYGHTPTQVALAWVLYNQNISAAITASTSISQLRQNLSALDVVMSKEEVEGCNKIWEIIVPLGWFLQMGDDMLALLRDR